MEAVKSWLIKNGIPASSIKQTQNQGWLTFETTANKLETLLNTKYSQYSHPSHKGTYIGTDAYKLPSTVAEHIDFIQPAVAFTPQGNVERPIHKRPFWPANKSLATKDCSKWITPDCLRTMYNFTKGSLQDSSNDLAIFEQTGEKYVQSDLNSFYAKYASYVPKNTKPKDANVNEQQDPYDSGEANLDYEMAVPIIYPQGTVNFEVGTTSTSQSFLDPLLEAIDSSYCSDGGDCGIYKAPNVISISYGDDEADYTTKFLEVRYLILRPQILQN